MTTPSAGREPEASKPARGSDDPGAACLPPGRPSPAQGFFRGEFHSDDFLHVPLLSPEERDQADTLVERIRVLHLAETESRPREAGPPLPDRLVAGLERLGAVGLTSLKEAGGPGFSHQGACRVLKGLGGFSTRVAGYVLDPRSEVHPPSFDPPTDSATSLRFSPGHVQAGPNLGPSEALLVCQAAIRTGLCRNLVRSAANRALQGQPPGVDGARSSRISGNWARLAGRTFAMEATTSQTAAFLDRGDIDPGVDVAILSVFTTEVLWDVAGAVLPIFRMSDDGDALFLDRILRGMDDTTPRLDTLESWRRSITERGIREIQTRYRETLEGLRSPARFFPTLWGFGRDRLRRASQSPGVAVETASLRAEADLLARRVGRFGRVVERLLVTAKDQGSASAPSWDRVADAVVILYTATCTIARLDRLFSTRTGSEADRPAGLLYVSQARRDLDRLLDRLAAPDDPAEAREAKAIVGALPIHASGTPG